MSDKMTHYEALGCSRSSSVDELKTAYRDLAKKHHPDKAALSPDVTLDHDAFKRIDEAWKTLRDPDLRRAYDVSLKQSEMEEQSLLYGSFRLHELDYDPDTEMYSHACRCGGSYSFTKKDSEEFDSYLVCCEGCSLRISVELQPT